MRFALLVLAVILSLGVGQPPQKPPDKPPGKPPALPEVEQHSITTMPGGGPSTLPAPKILTTTGTTRLRAIVGDLTAAPLRTDTAEPTEKLAIEFCTTWHPWITYAPDDQWYAVKINEVQQSWGGVLTKTGDCYRTTKAYSFPVGTHKVTVQLVMPAAKIPAGTDPKTSPCVPAKDCYGAPSEFLTVIAPPPPALKATLKAATTTTECSFTLLSDPPNAEPDWGVQFKQGTTDLGLRDAIAPYRQDVTLPVGSYSFTAVWSKATVPEVVTPAVNATCPG